MLKIHKFVFSPFQENTYLVWEESSRITAIIDPGCIERFEENLLSEFIDKNSLIIKYLINTHCHIDHIFGNAYVKLKYNCEFLAPEKDVFLIEMMNEQAKTFGFKIKLSPKPDSLITEKTSIKLNNEELEFLFTPGHTPGEYSVYSAANKICLTGDVLFYEGIGRTDLWGGDYKMLINSIKNKLFTLPDETKIYPGHGEVSSIGHEKKFNPFLS